VANCPDTETLALHLEDHILDIKLNRPESANAVNAPMWRELQEAFEWADRTAEVRVIILSGEGKHFCAGIDLSMFAGITTEHEDPSRANEQFVDHIQGLQRNLQSLRICKKPVLAAAHGASIGAAIDMICYADMRYCAAGTTFCVKEIDIGIVADVGTLQNLPGLMPDGLVRELALTGRNMDAEEAKESGFVTRVYPDRDALMAGVRGIAAQLAQKTPLAIRGTKRVLNYARDHTVEDGLEYVAMWNAAMMSKIDVEEAMTAKLEKRLPKFLD
jgi:enoyl-CoA hydratase